MEVIGYVLAILMGVSLGLIGGGGSILTVPILVYFFNVNAVTATTNSMFIVGITSLLGAILNARKKLVDFKTGILFATPSFLGVFVVRKLLLSQVPDSFNVIKGLALTKSFLILFSFGVLMIFASLAMLKSGKSTKTFTKTSSSIASIGVKGFMVGCITGFVGAGGGFLIVPALVILLNLPMRTAIGTSLAIIAANSLFGFGVSLTEQSINWSQMLAISTLGLIGLIVGLQFSSKIDESRLKLGFGYFIAVIAGIVLTEQMYSLFW